MYIHERPDWPNFTWDQSRLAPRLAAVRYRQGRLIGRMDALGFRPRIEASFEFLVQDVLKTSEIEGERLNVDQIRSSLARRLGLDIGALPAASRNIDGVVEMVLDATANYADPLTELRLWAWHAGLFPTGWSGLHQVTTGGWRTGPMEVVSGHFGHEITHFEAPAGVRMADEMSRFLDWFNGSEPIEPLLKAGLAHLWFVTIHPFDDGNGRVARAIADLALARSEDVAQRFYSMSSQIQLERKDYYQNLETTQKDSVDVSDWLAWFLECLDRALETAESTLASVLRKAHFWERLTPIALNERQHAMVNRMYDGFEGKLTTRKWATLTKVSPDTAHRDIADLIARGIFVKDPEGGRSTSYSLVDDQLLK